MWTKTRSDAKLSYIIEYFKFNISNLEFVKFKIEKEWNVDPFRVSLRTSRANSASSNLLSR